MSSIHTVSHWNRRVAAERLARTGVTTLLGTLALIYFWFGSQSGQLYDFGSFWASGKAALEGLDPYGVYPETFRSRAADTVHPNLNPPASLLLFAPLSLLDPYLTVKAQWWIGLLLYGFIVIYTLRRHPQPAAMAIGVWAFALPAFWDGIRLGQLYLPLMAGAALAWHLMERDRALAAGIVIGCLAAFKPNLLVWPALLFLAGHRRMALAAGGMFLLLSLAPMVVFGGEVYRQWLDMLAGDVATRSGFFANATVVAIGVRAGSHMLGIGLALLILAWGIRQVWGRGLDPRQASALGIGVAILVSPVAWMHYLLMLLPALLRMRWSPGIVAGAAVMAVPMLAPFWVFKTLPQHYPAHMELILATLGSLYSWGTLLLVVSLAAAIRNDARAAAPRSPLRP